MSLSAFSNAARHRSMGGFLAGICLALSALVAFADQPGPEQAKIFPATLGSFRQAGKITVIKKVDLVKSLKLIDDAPIDVVPVFVAETRYDSTEGDNLLVAVSKFENDAAAYSQFTLLRRKAGEPSTVQSGQVESVGTASALIRGPGLIFFKGANLVTVRSENHKNSDQANALARLVAATLDSGEGEIPVLVKHLPNWEASQRDLVYAVSQAKLLDLIPNQPILRELAFEGGTEAVSANYGQSQLVIVEFTTPQFSIDNDNRIWTKIKELKSQGQPAPTAYRRVGNYSVFVFNAPDEETANALVDQVRYEQVVQWLGDDPHMAERLTRYFRRTTSGVLIAVLKSSGLSLIFCAALGGLIGALLFRHRRSQKAALYSDAGGATRLNLDELTGASTSQRLLESGKQPEADS